MELIKCRKTVNIFKLFKLSSAALKEEDETYLLYLYGQQLSKVAGIQRPQNTKRRLPVHIIQFLIFCIKRISIQQRYSTRPEYVFFAETENQLAALNPTITSLQGIGANIAIYLNKKLNGNIQPENTFYTRFTIAGFCVAIILLITRAPGLYRRLKPEHNLAIQIHFRSFCMAYIYLPCFIQLLSQTRPKFAITSNDHNLKNRCFRLAAEMQGIKTVYMQHASVSEIFPPLQFDYAFLDGINALKTYEKCIKNHPKGKHWLQDCTIFLSGQKKNITSVSTDRPKTGFCIGIGTNVLDDFEKLKSLLDTLLGKGIPCYVRHHPAQNKGFVEKLTNYKKANPQLPLNISSPANHSLAEFFASINLLIAGNTSLHLEAALADIATFYTECYQNSDSGVASDYYGYVASGLSGKLPDDPDNINRDGLNTLAEAMQHNERRQQAIRYYSETYGTEWEHREGDLVAKTLQSLNGTGFESLYTEENSSLLARNVYRPIIRT